MKLTDWEAEIEKYDWLINSYYILTDDEDFDVVTIKIRIIFIDFTLLDFYESVDFVKNKYKYGFQWMNSNFELIRRWDNNPHHSHIPTYPFHQHIGSEENVHPSEEMNLEKVLDFIGKNIG